MYIVYKDQGKTPLETLEETRLKYNIGANIPMTYAGRLDPMAEGLLIVLSGEECKEKDKYLGLDKEYEFEILVGFSTDTYDLLGKITHAMKSFLVEELKPEQIIEKIKEVLPEFTGEIKQDYPAYSSKTVEGEPLFSLSKSGSIPTLLPSHIVNIHNIEINQNFQIKSQSDLLVDILKRIDKVNPNFDFRQKEIKNLWQESLVFKDYFILKLKVHVSSGTYIRQLVHDISTRIDVPLVTYSIKRTKVGEYEIDSINNLY